MIGEYFRWTGDLSLVEELKPNIERALEWIDRAARESGFLTYHQEAEKGFPNQGWKDSSNSIVHRSGEYASSPIALSEVQGYVYQAKMSLVPSFFELMGEAAFAAKLEEEAQQLQLRFEQSFWMEDKQFYAIALDKDREQVRSVTSNPGHLLMTGLPEASRAKQIAARLTAEDMFGGYGIRTMSTDAAGYYPMSYHNGSVWPHDNGMILLGLSRMGYKEEAAAVLSGLLEASRSFEYQRLPELFCGYDSELGYPVPYPSTCSPQAWAAATSVVFYAGDVRLESECAGKGNRHRSVPAGSYGQADGGKYSYRFGPFVFKSYTQPARREYFFNVEVLDNTTGFEVIRS